MGWSKPPPSFPPMRNSWGLTGGLGEACFCSLVVFLCTVSASVSDWCILIIIVPHHSDIVFLVLSSTLDVATITAVLTSYLLPSVKSQTGTHGINFSPQSETVAPDKTSKETMVSQKTLESHINVLRRGLFLSPYSDSQLYIFHCKYISYHQGYQPIVTTFTPTKNFCSWQGCPRS